MTAAELCFGQCRMPS